jgi:hypothetical protein
MERNDLVIFHVSPCATRFLYAYIPKKYLSTSLVAAENRFIDSLNLKMIAEVYEVFLFLVFVFFLLPNRTRKAGTQPKLKY